MLKSNYETKVHIKPKQEKHKMYTFHMERAA